MDIVGKHKSFPGRAVAATTANGVMQGYITIYCHSDVDNVFVKHQTNNGKDANDSLGAVPMTFDRQLLAFGSYFGDYQYLGHVIMLKLGDKVISAICRK